MLDVVNQYGNLLSPLSVLVQFLLWTTTGAGVCWGIMRRSIFRKATQIEKLQHDVSFWERKYQDAEAKFVKVLNSTDTSAGTSITSMLKYSPDVDDNDQSRLLDEWISVFSGPLAKVYARAAATLVSAHGSDPDALRKATSYAETANVIDPANPNHVELKCALATYESILSSIDGENYETGSFGEVLSRETLYALNNVHSKAFEDRNMQLAVLLAKRILDELQRRSDVEDFEIAIWQNNLAVALGMSGQTEQAIGYYARAHEVSESRVDEEGRTVHRISYGHSLASVGRYKEALPLLEAAYPDAIRVFGSDHPNVETCKDALRKTREMLSEWAD